MDIARIGLAAIKNGLERFAAAAENISKNGVAALEEDAVTVSLSSLQVKAGAAIIKTSEELTDSVLSLLDEKK